MKNVLEYLENVKTNNLVIDKNGSISYQKLLENSKKIGSGLGKFVKNNDPVPVYMEKGISALEVFMGALYSGGFYSLLNVGLPKMRLEQIINVLDVDYIVTDNEHLEDAKVFFPDKELILYEDLIKEVSSLGITGHKLVDYKKYNNKEIYEDVKKAMKNYNPSIVYFSESDIVKIIEKDENKNIGIEL